MRITDQQVKEYHEEGFLLLSEYLPGERVELMRAQLPALYAEDTPGRVLEKGTSVVRSVYGSHRTNEVFAALTRHPGLVDAAMRILESEVYVHQFKINAKQAFGGDIWEWHQDYIFWQQEDGMPTPRVTNAVVFLDEVNEFNGPLLFIPGSHKAGVLDPGARKRGTDDAPSWAADVAADLSYTLTREMIADMVRERGIVAPKGPAGSVLFFDANVAHGSAPNMSPFDRALCLVTYNSIRNTPAPRENPRPEFLCSRDFTAIIPLAEEPQPA
ncbi:MAG TPA: phytanoyl-CoA dioxygenase family protein [Longimicrobiaceae bacterium]|nr:phytanoyl-CoA dioxygenase family protein [Longimicrobiaceae bacterium]